jgi:hypothetical protein
MSTQAITIDFELKIEEKITKTKNYIKKITGNEVSYP